MSAVHLGIKCVPFKFADDVVCGTNTQTPNVSISNGLYINSELRLFQPNDICFARQWLHLALLFVTVQPILQSAVSKGRSGNIRNQTSVSLISSSLENYTCLFLLRDNLGRIRPLSTHCKSRAVLWTALRGDQSLKLTVLTGPDCHSHSCMNWWWKSMMKHILSRINQKWHQHTSRCSKSSWKVSPW